MTEQSCSRGVGAARHQGTGTRAERSATDDTGFTLVEMMVALSLLSVVVSVVMGAVIHMYGAFNRSEGVAVAQAQLDVAFARLDREVRYAAGISTAGRYGGESRIEFVTSYTGVDVCTQLQLQSATAQLQRRTWTLGAMSSSVTPWMPLASGVSETTAEPFTLQDAVPPESFDRLRVIAQATVGSGAHRVTTGINVAFTALNDTATGTRAAALCTAEGRTVA